MGRRKGSSGLGGLAVLVLGGIALLAQFVAEHITEILTVCAVIGGIWVAFALIKAASSRGSAAERDITPPSPAGTPSSAPPPKSRSSAQSNDGDRFWVPSSRSVALAGRDLGGMLYTGTGLCGVGNSDVEPALVNLHLPVARNINECEVRRLEHWPSYSTASREARASYLLWLQTGRKNPKADIGYVFLYFYGLERRALHDARQSRAAAAEGAEIEAEVERLLSIYGGQRSFQRYAGAFLDYLRAMRAPEQSYRSPPWKTASGTLSFCDRLALGQCAHDGAPLPADWAYHWVTHDANTSLGVAARRCPDPFEKLFVQLYQEKYGAGLVLPKNRTRLTLQYRAASGSFRGKDFSLNPPLTDVTVLTGPVSKLQALASQACEQLSSYSRVVGKDPTAASSFEALVQLPVALWPEQHRKQLERVRDIVSRVGRPAAIPFEKFRSWIPEVAELTRPKLKALSRALAGFGLAMEPDMRFGGSAPEVDSRIVVFADDLQSASEEASPRYQAAALTVQLAAAVAMADGSAGAPERALLTAQASRWPDLTESERRRLQALLQLLFLQGPKLNGLRKKMERLDGKAREAVAEFLVQVAQADNEVTAQEMKTLQKTFGLLGLDAQRVFSLVHGAAVAAARDGSTVTARAGYAIPTPPKAPKSSEAKLPAKDSLGLDERKIAALQQDSERVAKLLATVFENQPTETGEPSAHDEEESTTSASLFGLDAKHTELLQTLMTRTQWRRSELEELIEDRGLMVDGALERLNEAALEKLEMPLFDEGDPIQMNAEALEEISRAADSHA
jgi:uncharacterized tellurite resistance protein B-like protein